MEMIAAEHSLIFSIVLFRTSCIERMANMRYEIKQQAKQLLHGNYAKPIALLLILTGIFLFLTYLCQFISVLFNLTSLENFQAALVNMRTSAGLLFLIPIVLIFLCNILQFSVFEILGLGTTAWYWSFSHSIEREVTDIFHFFRTGSLFLRGIWYLFLKLLFSMLWAFLFYLPFSLVAYPVIFYETGFSFFQISPSMYGMLYGLSVFLFIVTTVFYLVFISRYFLADYIIVDDASVSARQALKISSKMMRGHKWQLFSLTLSFFGFFLLIPLTFGIILLFLVPYFHTVRAIYAKRLIDCSLEEIPASEACTLQF